MAYIFDDRLIEIKTRIARKKHLESKLKDLLVQMEGAKSNARVLMFEKDKEEKEAEKYEDSLLYRLQSLIGMGEGKLEKEKAEAADALIRYEAARSEYDAVCEEVVKVQDEYLSITETEEEYRRMLDIKRKYVVTYGDETSEKILETEEIITDIETSRLPEINEAIESGIRAQKLSGKLADLLFDLNLDSSMEIGRLFLGGTRGGVSGSYRLRAMEKADSLSKDLQRALSAFRAELGDVKTEISGIEAFSDMYYVIFSDMFVIGKASKGQKEAEELYKKITDILMVLEKKKNEAGAQAERLKTELEQLILTSNLKGE